MATTKITKAQAHRLTDEELRILAKQKNQKGNASAAARLAQTILLERAGHEGISSSHHPRLGKLSDEW